MEGLPAHRSDRCRCVGGYEWRVELIGAQPWRCGRRAIERSRRIAVNKEQRFRGGTYR